MKPNFKIRNQSRPHEYLNRDDLTSTLTQFISSCQLNSHNKDKSMDITKQLSLNNSVEIQRKQRLTKTFKGELDPRDRQFILPFQITFDVLNYQKQVAQNKKYHQNSTAKQYQFQNNSQYLKMLEYVYNFISEMCENVNSIAFRLLNEKKLTDVQAKAFASKNILENIQSILSQIRQKFTLSGFLTKKQVEELIIKLTNSIDEELNQILAQLASYYPQAPAVGESARMRETIVNVNRMQDETNDLIFAENIRIDKYIDFQKDDGSGKVINGDQNYTKFIMEVINAAINVTRDPYCDEQENTVFEKFQEFSQKLFFSCQHKDFKGIIDIINGDYQGSQGKRQQDLQEQLIIKYYKILQNKKWKNSQSFSSYASDELYKYYEKLKTINEKYQESIEQMRKNHKYALAQKIPNYVKPFSKNDLKAGNFHVNSSAILRIMTKWVEYLEQIFQSPQLHINQRVYDFKTISNKLISANNKTKQQLVSRLRKEHIKVKQEFNRLLEKNIAFQSFILSRNKGNEYSHLKRYTQVRSASSKMNAILTQFTHKYLRVLIHHLIKAGEQINVGQSIQNINLVVFRVGDLLRSKFECSQTTFVNVLKTLYTLDASREMSQVFKIVRVKNKLNQKDNNILINYLLFGKVQCELQLSIQDTKEKQKNYYSFSHFLYELTRGKFGVLTECAIIVSQHDPIVSSSSDKYYHVKGYKNKLKVEQKKEENNQTYKINQKDQSLFICSKCKQLIIRQNIHLFSQRQNICNQCIVKKDNNPELLLSDKKLRQYLSLGLKSNKIRKITSYSQINAGSYTLTVSNGKGNDTVKLFKTWEDKRQTKLFFIQINEQMLASFDKQGFDYSNIDYFDISHLKHNNRPTKQMMYLLEQDQLPSIFNLINIQQSLLQKIGTLNQEFQLFRLEKNIIKSIKFKSQIINLREDAAKFQVLNKVVKAYAGNKDALRYKKYKSLSFIDIKKVILWQMGLQQIPEIMKFTQQLRELNLAGNNLKQIAMDKYSNVQILKLDKNKIDKIELNFNHFLTSVELDYNCLSVARIYNSSNLKHLSISNNQLKQIDITNLSSLTYLNLYNNRLPQIDVKNNPLLTYLNLDQNQLITVDLANNRKLESFMFYKNPLTSIVFWYDGDLQGKLKELDGFTGQLTVKHEKKNLAQSNGLKERLLAKIETGKISIKLVQCKNSDY